MLEHLSSRIFAEQLNTTFHLMVPEAAELLLELLEVSEKDPSAPVEQFSLVFRGPLTPICPQGIYGVKHDKLGAFELFFVPLGPDPVGMRYQVIFCRLREQKK